MARLRVSWRPAQESCWDEVLVISPRDASLYVFPRSYWETPGCERLRAAIGLIERERVASLPDAIFESDRVPAGLDRSGLGGARFLVAEFSVRLLGLRRGLEWIVARAPRNDRSPEEVLARVKAWEGPRHGTRCLPRSVLRWSLLLGGGHRPALVLGLALPAARMHAWVTLDGRHVGEDPDEVAAYLPLVRYEARSPAAEA